MICQAARTGAEDLRNLVSIEITTMNDAVQGDDTAPGAAEGPAGDPVNLPESKSTLSPMPRLSLMSWTMDGMTFSSLAPNFSTPNRTGRRRRAPRRRKGRGRARPRRRRQERRARPRPRPPWRWHRVARTAGQLAGGRPAQKRARSSPSRRRRRSDLLQR